MKSFQRLDRLLLICGAGFSLALVIFALLHSFIVASLVLIICGAGATMTMNVANTQLQTSAPAGMRGRVMSLYTLIAAGFTPLGALLVSGLSTWIGLRGATLAVALGLILFVVYGFFVRSKSMQKTHTRQKNLTERRQ